MKPHICTDFYKVAHVMLHPTGTTKIYETLTPRENSYFPWNDKMTVFGYEYFVKKLKESWKKEFFDKSWGEVLPDFNVIKAMSNDLVYSTIVEQFESLHKVGYLPLKIAALQEGTQVNMRIPVLSIVNTLDEFYWLPGYLETTLLANTFVTSTSASVARAFRKVGQKYADLTSDNDAYLDFQFHDFSQRGQHGDEASVLSGLGHLTSFKGTDIIPAVYEAYQIWPSNEFYGGSVVATEHSVEESLAGIYGTDTQGQIDAMKDLIDRVPNGILSVVSDTYDYWDVIDNVLPALKKDILNRDGKLVIRPDSLTECREKTPNERIECVEDQLVKSLEAMYETFGGTINSKGFKVLDSHIGLLHGEGVNLDNVEGLLKAIMDAGFSTENIVLGVGAYVYSVLSSRDSFGQALKASAAIIDGKEVEIFKKPKSEKEEFKRSPKGAVSIHGESGNYEMVENLTIDESFSDEQNQMKVIFNDGYLTKTTSLTEIRETILKELDI